MEKLARFLPQNVGQSSIKQRSTVLQILAVILTFLTIVYTIITPATNKLFARQLPFQIIISLLVLLATIYLARRQKVRIAIHLFFIAQIILQTTIFHSSNVPYFAYFMLVTLVAVAILDLISASIVYAAVVLFSVTIFVRGADQVENEFLVGFYITAVSLGLTTWFATTNVSNALRQAQENATQLEQNNKIIANRSYQIQKSAEIGQVINSILDLKWLLSTAADLITDQFGFYFVGIYLLDETQKRLVLQGATSNTGHAMLSKNFSLNLQANAIVCWVAKNKTARITDNVQEDPTYLVVPELANTQSEVALPLLAHNTLLGVMDVQSNKPRAFQDEDIAFLQILANQIAGAIENAKIFAQTETQLNETITLYNLNSLLTTTLDIQEIYRRSALSFTETLDISRCSLHIWDKEANTLTSQIDYISQKEGQHSESYSLERRQIELLGRSNTHRVLHTLEPIIHYHADPNISERRKQYLDEIGMNICLQIPMVQGVEAIGLVELFRTQEQGPFTKNEIQLAQAMANQVANARQNAELATEARARAAQLSTLNRISTLVSLSPTLADVFDGTRREVFALFEATGLSIMLLTPDKTHINWIYGFEKGHEVDLSSIPPLPISQGFSGYVARTREVLHINRRMQEMSTEFQSLTVGALPSSWVGLPLIVANELIGVLAVENEYDNEAFTEQDVSLLKIIVGPLAIAINNLLQFARIEAALESQSKQRVQLQTAAEVSAAATSILDRQELIDRSVMLIQERFDLYYVGLFLLSDDGAYAVLRAGSGKAGKIQVAQGHRLEIGGQSLIGGAMSDGRVRITQDVAVDEEWRPNPILPDTKAELALPLKVRGRIIGALTVQSTHPHAFEDSLISTLQTMADQLAVAIENAQLLASSEARTRQQRLLNEVSMKMHRSTDVTEIIRTGLQALSDQLGGAPVSIYLGSSTASSAESKGEM